MYYTKLTGSLEPQPPQTRARYTLDSRKGDPQISRPVYIASNETINDTRDLMDKTPSRRTMRTEDMDMRPRVLDEDTQGRLLTGESEEYMRSINADAEKYARIGEKVITRLFKVQVPDDGDGEYINKRSETMNTMSMTKEQADKYLAENFRKQYTTSKSIDISRMDKPFSSMLNVFKEMNKTLMKSPQNTGMMKNMLNNMLIKDGDRTLQDIQNVMAILVNNPEYRIDYKPNSIYKTLGVLSNVVVGNNGDQQNGNTAMKDANPDIFGFINKSGRIQQELVKVINDMKKGLYDIREEEEEKDDVIVDIDNVLSGDDEGGIIPIPDLTSQAIDMGDIEMDSETDEEVDIDDANVVSMDDDEVLMLEVVQKIMEDEKQLVDAGKMTDDEYNETLRELIDQVAPREYTDKEITKFYDMLKLGSKKGKPSKPSKTTPETKENIFANIESLQDGMRNKKLVSIKKTAREFNRMVGRDSPYHIDKIDNYKKENKADLEEKLLEMFKQYKGKTPSQVVKPSQIFNTLGDKIKKCFIDNLTKKVKMNTTKIQEYDMGELKSSNIMEKITFLRKETRISASTYQKVLNCINRGVITSLLKSGLLTKKEGEEMRNDIKNISGNVSDRVDTLEIMLEDLLKGQGGSGDDTMKVFNKKKDKLKKKYTKKGEKIAGDLVDEFMSGDKKSKKKKKDNDDDILSQVDAILSGSGKCKTKCPPTKKCTSSWVEHCKAYMKKHKCSYKHAMKNAKSSYKK
jgi:hypothetical protein